MEPITILSDIASVQSLKDAWNLINKSNQRSRGISNISIKDFGDKLDLHLEKLANELRTGKFTFSPVRGTTIKKKDNTPNQARSSVSNEGLIDLTNLRPLRIPDIQDRIVHKALALKLEALLGEKFKLDNPCSFAYQKGKSIEDAIVAMGRFYQEGYKFILEADIVKFFDNVDSKALIEKVKKSLPDRSIDHLLDGAINQELGNVLELKFKKVFELYFQNSEAGIPQGNALSPLLANIYLSDFDQRMLLDGFKMIRYADDFIIMCKSRDEAAQAYKVAKVELEGKLKLQLHPMANELSNSNAKSTRIIDPRQDKFSFLSVRFDGSTFWIDENKVKSVRNKLMCLTSIEDRKRLYPDEEIGLFQALTKLKNLLDGWIAAYYFLDCDKQVQELNKYVNIILRRLFESFGMPVQKSLMEKISLKGHRRQQLAFTVNQRRQIGIPDCHKILMNARKGIPSINERIQELSSVQFNQNTKQVMGC